jgi:hypothetical protein
LATFFFYIKPEASLPLLACMYHNLSASFYLILYKLFIGSPYFSSHSQLHTNYIHSTKTTIYPLLITTFTSQPLTPQLITQWLASQVLPSTMAGTVIIIRQKFTNGPTISQPTTSPCCLSFSLLLAQVSTLAIHTNSRLLVA